MERFVIAMASVIGVSVVAVSVIAVSVIRMPVGAETGELFRGAAEGGALDRKSTRLNSSHT